jgi:predicted aldo/keto reductase-like oxidoreductase
VSSWARRLSLPWPRRRRGILESLQDLDAIEAADGVLKVVREARDQKVTRFAGITGHADPVAMKAALERHDFDCVQMRGTPYWSGW